MFHTHVIHAHRRQLQQVLPSGPARSARYRSSWARAARSSSAVRPTRCADVNCGKQVSIPNSSWISRGRVGSVAGAAGQGQHAAHRRRAIHISAPIYRTGTMYGTQQHNSSSTSSSSNAVLCFCVPSLCSSFKSFSSCTALDTYDAQQVHTQQPAQQESSNTPVLRVGQNYKAPFC